MAIRCMHKAFLLAWQQKMILSRITKSKSITCTTHRHRLVDKTLRLLLPAKTAGVLMPAKAASKLPRLFRPGHAAALG